MRTDNKALRPTAIVIALSIAVALLLQALPVNGGAVQHDGTLSGTPRSVFGYVYWPNGTLATGVPMWVSITNNKTQETGYFHLNTGYQGNPDGCYNIDIGNPAYYPTAWMSDDTIFVNITHQSKLGMNETLAKPNDKPQTRCDLQMIEVPFGPQAIGAGGGSITGYGGAVTLEIPAGALASDTLIYGVNALSAMHGSFDSITLLPSPLSFSDPAVLRWSYDGLDIGPVPEDALTVFTSNGGPWERLPGYVDTVARQVVAQVSHFTNFSMGGAFAFGNQSVLTSVYPATIDAPILELTIINTDPVADDTLEYIHVISNSTDDSDIGGIKLWIDADDDGIVGSGDIFLAGPLPPGGANFTALAMNIPADSTLNLLIAVDVSGTATAGNVIDLLIPMYGIGLANAGLLLDAIDPPGDVTVWAEPTEPHAVYGFVFDTFGVPLPHAWVNLTNNRTGTTENTMADDLGMYDINLGFMPGGYAHGDEIFVMANDTLGQAGWNITYVDVNNFGERCDIHIAPSGPVAYNETPMNGSVIADIHRNVTVNITGGIGGLNLTTIILEVEGLNYTWGDPNLEFAGETLTFNTSGAVGAWADGQIVNVTLWQANDIVGNPCQNAPYSWWFLVSLGAVEAPANLTLSDDAGAVKLTWDVSPLATSYDVYRSADRFAAWPWPVAAAGVLAPEWSDAPGTYIDANTYYYIVRAQSPGGESGNSSMGSKTQRSFTYLNPTLRTNLNWISMPYNSKYKKLSDIVLDIEGGLTGADRDRIVGVYYWNATQQQMVGITWGGFGWNLANDVDIRPGDGICLVLSNLMTVGQQFFWTIAGTDLTSTQNFTYLNPALRTNLNWISMPYSSTYERLSDIVIGIEGGLTGADRDYIVGAYYWNATQQQMVGITWGGFGWNLANDIIIRPDDGICLVLSNLLTVGQQFSWEPALISAPVPDIHYYD